MLLISQHLLKLLREIRVKRKLKHQLSALWRRIYYQDVPLMATSAPLCLFERLRPPLVSLSSTT